MVARQVHEIAKTVDDHLTIEETRQSHSSGHKTYKALSAAKFVMRDTCWSNDQLTVKHRVHTAFRTTQFSSGCIECMEHATNDCQKHELL